MFQVILTNFSGDSIFEGYSLHEVMEVVKKTGLEATVNRDNSLVASFSPISGWKFF